MNNATVLLGGSFNPVHYGHLAIIKALKKHQFREIILVPTKSPPHKKKYEISDKARLSLLKAALVSEPKIKISRFELKQKRTSYSYYAINHFKKTRKNLFFALGEDAFAYIPHWFKFPEVFLSCHFIVFSRQKLSPASSKKTITLLVRKKLIKKTKPFGDFSKVFITQSGHLLCFSRFKVPNPSSSGIRSLCEQGKFRKLSAMTPIWRELKTLKLYGKNK
ncbi:MAG: nicotinate (nicotinamide) nucleotide adenylyltransferase [Bacteriovoracia bacterium]